MIIFLLVSGNGDIGLPSNPRIDIQYPGGASSRLIPSQDIIRHPTQSPMRPQTNSARLETPNGLLILIFFFVFFLLH
jgi:hypothetical protein